MNKKELNDFFVDVFNQILYKEEKIFENTAYEDLTIKECHVLEAIYILQMNDENTMTHIANKLNISVGALTTSIKTLIKKDYVERKVCEKDHRIIKIKLTQKGNDANKLHEEFHNKLIDCIMKSHSIQELQVLSECLKTFTVFFKTIQK